jgi:hypothetical protein
MLFTFLFLPYIVHSRVAFPEEADPNSCTPFPTPGLCPEEAVAQVVPEESGLVFAARNIFPIS